jgi:hypothetical protein
MLDTPDTARRIQSLKAALAGVVVHSQTPVKASDLGDRFMDAGATPEQLAGDGAARYAAAADLLVRQNGPGTSPRRLGDALVEIGYTTDRLERLLALRGPKLREEILGAYQRARASGMSPDPYLACCLILEDGVRDDLADETRRRILEDYRKLAAA